MVQLQLRNPTQIIFGDGQIAFLKQLVKPGIRVLLRYASDSIKNERQVSGLGNNVTARAFD
jgi:alcohol dehydrogenase YqhD (iron-dependent ADH family)